MAVEETMNLPDWVDQSALILLALGFPVVLLLAWAQESRAPDAGAQRHEAAESLDGRPSCSVAVLPFDDLSRDGSFQDSADGISEDIITTLSFLDPCRVSARSSSFAFKGQSPDIRDVGRQLNVRYVLEGSIRKVSDNARITAQLIDAGTGEHVWSKNFDCPIESIDEEIDKIAPGIVVGTGSSIVHPESRRLTSANPDDLSVADLNTVVFFYLGDMTRPNIEAAEKLVQISLDKAPNDGYAHALMARVQASAPLWGLGKRSERWPAAVEHLRKVKSAGTPDMPTLFSMAMADYYMGKLDDLERYAARMCDLGPNHPGSAGLTALSLLCAGKYQEYLETGDHSQGLWSPHSPFYLMFLLYETTAYLGLRNFAQTEAHARQYLSVRDHPDARELFVVALAHQGKLAEAASELNTVKAMWPEELTLETAEERFRLFFDSEDMIHLHLEGLRLAGLD